MYTETDVVRIAKRQNNNKRNYLVVNPLQGKHIPVSPTAAFALFDTLAEKIKNTYGNENILFIGFAETATAIGARVAAGVGGLYIQTTREDIAGADYLIFSESHSHAVEQRLVKNDIDKCIGNVDRIIFVEDEVTTGNTILHLVNVIEDNYGYGKKFAVASLLNGMNDEDRGKFYNKGIDIHCIVKTNHDGFPGKAERAVTDGKYYEADIRAIGYNYVEIYDGCRDGRRMNEAADYQNACDRLWEKISENIDIDTSSRYLLVGTEECMYPAMYVGYKLERRGCYVRSHSTTRSPIEVGQSEDYPLHERYELKSLYDDGRVTFIYDIAEYEKVIVVTDSDLRGKAGLNSLINALKTRNSDITVIRWC